MKSFLQEIAKDLLEKYGEDLHGVTVVFPNKRASLFLNQELALQSAKPVWSPRYTTISELFQSNTSLRLADRIKLIFELYKSYTKVTGATESLEQFYGWGELMLADFDDIDKHLADAKKVFTLLGDIHELDSVDYLTEEQQKVLQRFFKNFSKDHTTVLKQRFLNLWSKFYDIYTDYHNRLKEQSIAYEGMLYREGIRELGSQGTRESGPYIFIGFNYLTTVEEQLIAYYVSESGGKVCEDQESCPPKHLSFGSSPTDDLQARYISQWLTPERIAAGRKTAIVLADESLLETVLHCLPEGMTLNITTGYPLAQTSIATLVRQTASLLQKGRYTLHNINAILRHPLARFISPEVYGLHNKLNKDLIYYLTPEEVSVDDNLRHFFAPMKDATDVEELIERLTWVVKTIAVAPSAVEEESGVTCHDALTTESLYRMYTLLNRLRGLISEEGVTLDINLFNKLLQQIIQGTTVPFHGEPIEGVQIMGVLETRNLDFDHVLLLSCNEGKMPAKINDSSFLPHSIRVAYNLTTIENKVSIYEYYFDRLLQRTNDVTIVYNNATTDGKTGEMSRFMLQLIAESPLPIKRFSLEATQEVSTHECKAIEKTPQMIDTLLRKRYISPSALGKYLRCPVRFYYLHVEGIRENDNGDEESMDNMAFGTIFHEAAEIMYRDFKGKVVPHDYIASLLKEEGHPTLRRIVEQAFRKKLFNIPDGDNRKTPVLGGLQVINFEMVVTFLEYLLRYDSRLTRLEIRGLEQEVSDSIAVDVNGSQRLVKIGGSIDRLDVVTDEDGVRRMRVIDYKTGRLYRPLQVPDVASIFNRESRDGAGAKFVEHADYFLQALLYSYIIDKQQSQKQEISSGDLYVQQSTGEGYDPLLKIGGESLHDATPYLAEFQQELSSLISEILSLDKPFLPTSDAEKCRTCSFYNFCH